MKTKLLVLFLLAGSSAFAAHFRVGVGIGVGVPYAPYYGGYGYYAAPVRSLCWLRTPLPTLRLCGIHTLTVTGMVIRAIRVMAVTDTAADTAIAADADRGRVAPIVAMVEAMAARRWRRTASLV